MDDIEQEILDNYAKVVIDFLKHINNNTTIDRDTKSEFLMNSALYMFKFATSIRHQIPISFFDDFGIMIMEVDNIKLVEEYLKGLNRSGININVANKDDPDVKQAINEIRKNCEKPH